MEYYNFEEDRFYDVVPKEIIRGCRFIGILPWEDDLKHAEFYQSLGETNFQPGDIISWRENLYVWCGDPNVGFVELNTTTESGPASEVPKVTNCCNCGAPLFGQHSCAYCGTYNH